jgi:hypothetical protein
MSPNYDNNVVHEKWVNGERIVMGSGADKIYDTCPKCGKEVELGWGHDCTPIKQSTIEELAWENPPLSNQVGGNHYKDMKIQPIEFITANNLGFIEGNVVKYICRHEAKNGAEDIKKVIHYCELLLQTKYGEK